MAFGSGAGEHERTVNGVGVCLALCKNLQGLRQQGDDLRLAVLGFGDHPFLAHEVDLIPTHREYVGAARPGDQAHLDVVAGHGISAFVHCTEEGWKLFTGQESRTFVFLVPSDAAAGVQSIVKLCSDGLAENAADQGQHAVGGYGVRFRDLVEDGLDFADADLGQAALCEVDAVLPVGQVLGELGQVLLERLLARLAVLLVEQREHLAEGDFRALLALLVGWVAAQSHLAVMFDGLGFAWPIARVGVRQRFAPPIAP